MSVITRPVRVSTSVAGDPAELLDVASAAAQLGTPVRFIRRLIAERRIRFYKIGRYVRIDRHDLDDYIAAHRVEARSSTAAR
jgi:excisionase family DNA binding protein